MEVDNKVQGNWFDKQATKFDSSRYALMTVLMIAQSCWGSVAAMFAMKLDDVVLLSISVAVTMASNSAFIAQGPAKWCLGLFYLSAIANLLVFLISFFSL